MPNLLSAKCVLTLSLGHCFIQCLPDPDCLPGPWVLSNLQGPSAHGHWMHQSVANPVLCLLDFLINTLFHLSTSLTFFSFCPFIPDVTSHLFKVILSPNIRFLLFFSSLENYFFSFLPLFVLCIFSPNK